MALSPIRPSFVPVPSAARRPIAPRRPQATTSRRVDLSQEDTFEASGAGYSPEEVGKMIFQKMFDQAEKRRREHAAENDPWK